MEILTITMYFVLIIAALLLITYPLWQATQPETDITFDPVRQRIIDHQTRYETALDNIKQLMFDYEVGKISDNDYQRLLEQAKQEAADIRRMIDYYSEGVVTATEFALDAKAEMLINQMRQELHELDPKLVEQTQREITNLVVQPPQRVSPSGNGQVGGYCAQCGQSHQPEDRFCTACGTRLAEPPSELATETT